MISISGKHWSEKKIDKNLVEILAQKENFSQILSTDKVVDKFVTTVVELLNFR